MSRTYDRGQNAEYNVVSPHKDDFGLGWLHPDLFWPDAQVEVEAGLQQQVLHIVWVDGEVEVQRVSQQLVGFLIALPKGNHTTQDTKFSDH